MPSIPRGIFENILFGKDEPCQASRTSCGIIVKKADNATPAADKKSTSPKLDDEDDAAVSTASSVVSRKSSFQTSSQSRWGEIWKSPILDWILSRLQHIFQNRISARTAWRPTFLQLRPLIGLCALLVTVGSNLCSLAVLLLSHTKPTSHWPFAPTVYLAIFTALGNRYVTKAQKRTMEAEKCFCAGLTSMFFR